MACEWIMDGISFQKIYGLCGLKGHIVEIRRGVTLVDGRRTTDNGQRKTECEDRARILETEFLSIRVLGYFSVGCVAACCV